MAASVPRKLSKTEERIQVVSFDAIIETKKKSRKILGESFFISLATKFDRSYEPDIKHREIVNVDKGLFRKVV